MKTRLYYLAGLFLLSSASSVYASVYTVKNRTKSPLTVTLVEKFPSKSNTLLQIQPGKQAETKDGQKGVWNLVEVRATTVDGQEAQPLNFKNVPGQSTKKITFAVETVPNTSSFRIIQE